MNPTSLYGQPSKSTQKEKKKKCVSSSSQTKWHSCSINLTYYTMSVGNLLRKAEAGLRKGNTAFPSHIYKNKSKMILLFISSPGTTLCDSAEINSLTLKMCGQPLHSK